MSTKKRKATKLDIPGGFENGPIEAKKLRQAYFPHELFKLHALMGFIGMRYRAKAKCPIDKEKEKWIGCGDCGTPDSQNHWIRECNHAKATAIRNMTLYQANSQV